MVFSQLFSRSWGQFIFCFLNVESPTVSSESTSPRLRIPYIQWNHEFGNTILPLCLHEVRTKFQAPGSLKPLRKERNAVENSFPLPTPPPIRVLSLMPCPYIPKQCMGAPRTAHTACCSQQSERKNQRKLFPTAPSSDHQGVSFAWLCAHFLAPHPHHTEILQKKNKKIKPNPKTLDNINF